ncbi:hypothetical protein F5144DRAFT_346681 [Chaetomium tenue]|uniref:Uncharacterized protein n=1 Tax=Chaetomium tenue TaxID=1854479 RepID=A0ACB7NZC5_9PEZI|nr:hypothetical protein F5144DRAFT_346681 [Chaetomium globosum]
MSLDSWLAGCLLSWAVRCGGNTLSYVDLFYGLVLSTWALALFGLDRFGWGWSAGGREPTHPCTLSLSLSSTDDDFFMWHGKHETADGQAGWCVHTRCGEKQSKHGVLGGRGAG